MDEVRFWKLIAQACKSDPELEDVWDERLVSILTALPPDEIIEWDRSFHRLTRQAYKVDLWGAAYLINGGASDDGFYYFCCWLVCMGQEAYEAAIADPDSLADLVEPDLVAESETYAVGRQAWLTVTGKPDTDPYPVESGEGALDADFWDFEDEAEVRRRLPRLASIYLD